MRWVIWLTGRPLLAQRGRMLLTLAGVALGVAMPLGIRKANEASVRGFRAGLELTAGRAALEITAPAPGLDERLLPEMTWLREWGVATPVLQADVWLEPPGGGDGVVAPLIGIDALRDPAVRDYALMSGQEEPDLAAGMGLLGVLGGEGVMVLSGAVAADLGVAEGDELVAVFGDGAVTARVGALLAGAGRLAVMDIAAAQVALERAGWLDRLDVRLHDGVDVAEAEAAVRERLPAGLKVGRPERRGEAVERMLEAFHFNLTMLSGIALVVGLFMIYNTLSVEVMARRAEIGMLRTLGVGRAGVFGLFGGQALLFAVAGGLAGAPLGQALAWGAVKLTSATVDALYVSHSAVMSGLSAGDFVAGLMIAAPLACLAAAGPVWEAVRVPPVAAVRGLGGDGAAAGGLRWRLAAGGLAVCAAGGWWAASQEPVGGLPLWGHAASGFAVAGLAFAAPLALALAGRAGRPVLGRLFGVCGLLAAGQVGASARRLSVSVAALAVSLALTLAIAIMVGSFRRTVEFWVDQSMGADLYLRPAVPPRATGAPAFRRETLEVIQAHPAVELTDGYRALDAEFRGRMIRLGTGDFQVQAERAKSVLKTPGDAAQLLAGARERGEVMVSEPLALRFGIREGDEIELDTREGARGFRVAAVFYDYSSDRGAITMDHELFERHFGEANPTHLAVYLRAGQDPEAVLSELLRQLSGARVAGFTNAGLRAEVMRIFDGTFAITWALELVAVVVAMGGVAATMLTLLLERRDEMRLLRLAGADAGQVRRTVLIEAGLIGAVSQALALVAGTLLSLVLIEVINPQSFGWTMRLHFPGGFVAVASVVTVAATMAAGWLPARAMLRAGLGAGGWLRAAQVWVAAGVLAGSAARAEEGENWEPVRAGQELVFPRDHGQHPETKIEWWYFTGNLESEDGTRRLGYQLTFFRIGARMEPEPGSAWALRDVWMAHFAVTDITGARYLHAERLNRAGPGLAGAALDQLRVWNEDWSAEEGADGVIRLRAGDRELGLELELDRGGAAPVPQGVDGFSQKGSEPGNASMYYSMPRLRTSGRVRVGDDQWRVKGLSWMDHEFGSSFLEEGQTGWDWFSIQFADGESLMAFRLRHREGGDRERFAGAWIGADGGVRSLGQGGLEFDLEAGRRWRSPETGADYPVEWMLRIPGLEAELRVSAALDEQELRGELTPGLHYWEGAVTVEGMAGGQRREGRGYLEMTGYAGRPMSAWFGAREGDSGK